MKIKHYLKLKEDLVTETLDNGLKIVMIPKLPYHKTFAVLTTNYGALEQKFSINGGSVIDIPAGTAHFLEHKLFEKKNEDAFTKFGELGADANAFTNAFQTSYLFSTAQNFIPALIHLLDFVQTPYFTEKTVAKEQGIIGQEIQMYDDDPNWALYMGLLNTLYPGAAIAQDIAGTQNSILKITPELLYKLHSAFYQPNQLTLHIVGHFNPKEILAAIHDNQDKKNFKAVKITHYAEKFSTPNKIQVERHFNVSRPKVAFGIRVDHDNVLGVEGAKRVLIVDILNDLLFGEQTDWYQDLYSRGIIDTEFETSFDIIKSYQYVSFFSETEEYDLLTDAIQGQIDHYSKYLENQQNTFESLRKATIGEGIQKLNSLENIALQGDDVLFGTNLFDKIELLQDLTFDDILVTADKLYRNATLQRFLLRK
ncbi:EF-P 5-aminopentanol modification-associated protein YfmH [Leuconostoc litchii]|uniref:Insulinase family protein n=1 Tax=Leuconostoc litchii TaxID=1981069 RepID=A0A6P2CSV1_9LACO|nr:pitrilysin family protein [Leuconostoc litchii]TYC47347.1 insulinase family protein [Leuconostoc litchii]